jgi:molybdopterin adenylyltransferase
LFPPQYLDFVCTQWLVIEARKISNQISADNVVSSYFPDQQKKIIDSLDSFGYDQAAEYVYGCTYPEWKRLHQKETTVEQVERYNASKHLHANHDNEILAICSPENNTSHSQKSPLHLNGGGKTCVGGQVHQNSLLSDVCCQDVDNLTSTAVARVALTTNATPRPPKGDIALRVGILTVSDRASANTYETGDLSGPAVEKTMIAQIDHMNKTYGDQNIAITCVEKCVVPDEIPRIKEILERWSGKMSTEESSSNEAFDLVFTTGGTGFAKRDVTPEATLAVLDRECQGLLSWASMELTSKQPLATLSRATAGVCGNTLIVNLPGNPTGAAQMVEFLFPFLLHAVLDLRSSN